MNEATKILTETLEPPMTMSAEPYISEAYARDEKDLLWRKVWQVACREEEIPEVGDYYTYEILDQSFIVARTAPDEFSAYYNVCRHRGRRLTKGCGHATRFQCKYHGWQWTLNGEIASILDREDWGGVLEDESLKLGSVQVGRWAGFVFINLDPDGESLETFLDPIAYWLDPFEIGKMRYQWRKWTRLPCNWKVAVEAFTEAYHAPITHPQTGRYGAPKVWSHARGKHGQMGQISVSGGGIGTSVSDKQVAGRDVRKVVIGAIQQQRDTVGSLTTDTLIAASKRLLDVLPETATAPEVSMVFMQMAREMDAERGVIWPDIDPQHVNDAGINWSLFPNTVLLQNFTFCLGFRVRPDGYNPDSCIFEVYHLERYPEGEEPKPENVYEAEHTEEKWKLLIFQDIENMTEVQQGMKSDGITVLRPNPFSENAVVNFRRVLAEYMGRAAPEPYPAT